MEYFVAKFIESRKRLNFLLQNSNWLIRAWRVSRQILQYGRVLEENRRDPRFEDRLSFRKREIRYTARNRYEFPRLTLWFRDHRLIRWPYVLHARWINVNWSTLSVEIKKNEERPIRRLSIITKYPNISIKRNRITKFSPLFQLKNRWLLCSSQVFSFP